jgi:hypothetical protein
VIQVPCLIACYGTIGTVPYLGTGTLVPVSYGITVTGIDRIFKSTPGVFVIYIVVNPHWECTNTEEISHFPLCFCSAKSSPGPRFEPGT